MENPLKPSQHQAPQSQTQQHDKQVEADVKQAESEKKKDDQYQHELKQKEDARKSELLETMRRAIKEYDGESNIPVGHEYWQAVNEYRGLTSKQSSFRQL